MQLFVLWFCVYPMQFRMNHEPKIWKREKLSDCCVIAGVQKELSRQNNVPWQTWCYRIDNRHLCVLGVYISEQETRTTDCVERVLLWRNTETSNKYCIKEPCFWMFSSYCLHVNLHVFRVCALQLEVLKIWAIFWIIKGLSVFIILLFNYWF